MIDGLRASALGAYGNTTFPTPYLDKLASGSLVVDWLWSDSIGLLSFYRSVWQSQQAIRGVNPRPETLFPSRLHQAGVRQWLATDDAWMAEQASRQPWDKALLLETAAEWPAESIEETVAAQLFSEVVLQLNEWREALSDTDSGSLLWLHARGLTGPWDAPTQLQLKFLEEGDPEPLESVQTPGLLCDVDDPDEILRYRIAYAAQVAVLDACVGAFVEAIAECFADSETLIMLAGSQGFALGEHGEIGSNSNQLFSERLHLPWLISLCGQQEPLQRHAGLTQPADLGATILDWFGQEPADQQDGLSLLPKVFGKPCLERQLAVSQGLRGEQTLRTPAWLLRQASDSTTSEAELYAKPDDRWECNDIASRCPQIVENLACELEQFSSCIRENQPLPLSPSDSELISTVR